jgi:hypothetical protein
MWIIHLFRVSSISSTCSMTLHDWSASSASSKLCRLHSIPQSFSLRCIVAESFLTAANSKCQDLQESLAYHHIQYFSARIKARSHVQPRKVRVIRLLHPWLSRYRSVQHGVVRPARYRANKFARARDFAAATSGARKRTKTLQLSLVT